MNLKTCLQLNNTFKFHNVCTIYPIQLVDVLSYADEDEFISKFSPYMLSYDIMGEDSRKFPLFNYVITNEELVKNLYETLKLLCKVEHVFFNDSTNEIFFEGYKESLNENNFDEFSDVVLEIIQGKKFSKPKEPPKFETQEGYERWKKLQANRERFKKKQKPKQLCDIINTVQFGMGAYITDSEISKWTYWKLIKSYLTIINKENYENGFNAYIQCGDKKLIENHWSELSKF